MRSTKTVREILRCVFLVFLLSVVALCIWKIWNIQSEYAESNSTYAEAQTFISISESKTDSTHVMSKTLEETEEVIDWPTVDFAALEAVNPDIVGWLYIEDTEINYPIVRGRDNSYYLSHMYNGDWNGSGSIFMDFQNNRDFSDPNSVLYGHHMKNGSMFHDLDGYKDQSFYELHKTAYLLTPDKNYLVVFFAGYVANVKDDAWTINFSDEEFEAWYMKAIERSCFDSGIVPSSRDRIVTLSTCSYEYDNARFVVLGIMK